MILVILPFFIKSAFSATTVSNVVCNGKDKVTFTLSKDAGSILGQIQTSGCANADYTLDDSTYTQNGDTYLFDFNPYTTCMGAADPNNAATYSIDFKLMFSDKTVIGGQEMFFAQDTVDLKCTFQSTYSLTSDLGGVNLEGDQLVGETFELSFDMIRTQSDFSTPETGSVVTNTVLYHSIQSTSTANLDMTDFEFVPSKISLQKKNSSPLVSFDLFSSTMTTCGYSEVGFELNYDSTNNRWNFKYTAFLLDVASGDDYVIIADMELCNSLATDPKCTAAKSLCVECACANGTPKAPDACLVPGTNDCDTCDAGYSLIGADCMPTCACTNGNSKPAGVCSALNADECESCDTGYTLTPGTDLCSSCSSGYGKNGDVCQPECTCQNGDPVALGVCTTSGANECAGCDAGYGLNGDQCEVLCTCQNGDPQGPGSCTTAGQNKCATCASGYALNGDSCDAVCTCANGNPASLGSCSAPGANECSSCDAGYGLNGNQCAVACTCSGGTPKPPGECSSQGANECVSCNGGFGLNNDGTCVDISEMTIINHGYSHSGSSTPTCYPRPFLVYDNLPNQGGQTHSNEFNYYWWGHKWIIIPKEIPNYYNQLSWPNAQTMCQYFSGVNNGGTLVTDFYETELEFMRNMLSQYHSNTIPLDWHVGLGYGGHTNDGLWWWWDQNDWAMRFPDHLNQNLDRNSWDSNYGYIAGPKRDWRWQNQVCKHACLSTATAEKGWICELRC